MAGSGAVFTVIAAASSYDLTTLAVVKDELVITGTDGDVSLNRYIKSCSAAVAQYCNRVFQAETVKDEFWLNRDLFPCAVPGGKSPLQLTRWPIVSITSVTENDVTLVDGADFRIDCKNGHLIRLDANGYPRNWPALAIAVQYIGGFATVPADVVEAVLRLIKKSWFSRGADPSLKSENVSGVYEYQRWFATGSEAGNMTPDVVDILDNYRIPIVG